MWWKSFGLPQALQWTMSVRSLSPLFADRILFLECEVLLFGAARRMPFHNAEPISATFSDHADETSSPTTCGVANAKPNGGLLENSEDLDDDACDGRCRAIPDEMASLYVSVPILSDNLRSGTTLAVKRESVGRIVRLRV